MTETSARAALRQWVVDTSGKISADQLRDDTPLLEQRILSSLQLTDLILFLEELRDGSVNLTNLTGAAFKDLNAVYDTFLADAVS